MPSISGGALSLASSGLGDKTGMKSSGGVFVWGVYLELVSPQYSWEDNTLGKRRGMLREEKNEHWINGSQGEE